MGVDTDLALAIIPKVGSTISIPCSCFIIFEAISDHRKGRGTAIQRALVGMSVVDVSASFAWFLSTWAVPEGTAPFARGNLASCNFQGFLLQLAVGAPLYNCSLALYYMLVIKYNWKNAQLIRIEKYVHAFIITFAVGTSIAGLPLTMYNRVTSVCWVIGSPADCGNSISNPSGDIPCDRGDWAWLFGIILFYGPLWICVLLTLIAMVSIYMKVRQTFRQNEKYNFEGRVRRDSVMSNNGKTEAMTGSNSNMDQISRDQSPQSLTTDETDQKIGQVENLESDKGNSGYSDDCFTNESNYAIRTTQTGGTTRVLINSEASNGIGLKGAWQNSTNPPVRTAQANLEATRNQRRSSMASKRNRKQNQFAIQAILYSVSFFVTWLPSTIWSVTYWFGVGGITFDLLAASCEPLQGFWNMLIFVRSRPSSKAKLRRIFRFFCCWFNVQPINNGNSISSLRVSKGLDESDPSDVSGYRPKSGGRRNSSNIVMSLEVIASEDEEDQSSAQLDRKAIS